jgi:hypothetical protein
MFSACHWYIFFFLGQHREHCWDGYVRYIKVLISFHFILHCTSPKSECGHLNGGKSKAVTCICISSWVQGERRRRILHCTEQSDLSSGQGRLFSCNIRNGQNNFWPEHCTVISDCYFLYTVCIFALLLLVSFKKKKSGILCFVFFLGWGVRL